MRNKPEHLKVTLKVSNFIHSKPQNYNSQVSFTLRTPSIFLHVKPVGEWKTITPKHASLRTHQPPELLTVKAEEAHFGFCCHIIPSKSEKADLLILVGFL